MSALACSPRRTAWFAVNSEALLLLVPAPVLWGVTNGDVRGDPPGPPPLQPQSVLSMALLPHHLCDASWPWFPTLNHVNTSGAAPQDLAKLLAEPLRTGFSQKYFTGGAAGAAALLPFSGPPAEDGDAGGDAQKGGFLWLVADLCF